MNLLGLEAARADRPGAVKERCVTLESLVVAPRVSHQAHTCAELRQQIHEDLRSQHPEWIQPNGESPTCDEYEARLTETLERLIGAQSG